MVAEIGTTALSKLADGFAKELIQTAKGIASKSLGKLQAEFGVGFEKYVQRNQDRCRFIKTLLHRIEPVPLEQAYVEPQLEIGREAFLGSNFPEELIRLRNVVIVGSGGSGKSMFLKKLFLDLCESPAGKIPIFIELRDLNSRDDKDPLRLAYQQWSELIPSFQFEALESGFRTGKFLLLLDGLDEIDKDDRDKVAQYILKISYKFPECPVLLTSRPISDFSSWHEFHTAKILPFDLPRVEELVEKTNIDAETKSKFLIEVRERLFASHTAFLANPLLCTMMVLTYTEFEEIPSKMHIFYSRAFDVLFTRHDKTKTFFKRTFYTTLAEDDFKRCFATFCLFSYLDGKYSFDKEDALNLISQVFSFENCPAAPKDFLCDMHESISILVRDGDTFSFLHRSFQEYFAAVFLADRQVSGIQQIFQRVLAKSRGDNVLGLLSEMNRDALESKFLVRAVRQFRNELVKLSPRTDLALLSALMIFRRIVIDPKAKTVTWEYGPRYELLRFISIVYEFDTGADDLETDNDEWLRMHGVGSSFAAVLGNPAARHRVLQTSEIPNAKLAKWSSLVLSLKRVRSEVIELDKAFVSKGKTRSNFVQGLVKKKAEARQ